MKSHIILAGCVLLGLVSWAISGAQEIKPVNLDKLNTEADEDDPCPLADDVTLLYVSKARGTFDIYRSERASTKAAWPPGKPMANVSSADFDERTPFYHSKTQMLYFAMNKGLEGEEKNFDIVRKVLQTAPVPVPGITSPADELGPFVTPLGKECYFSRMTSKGWTLYVADGPTPGPIGSAKAVGFPPEYHRATLALTGLVMYLQGPVDGDEEKAALYRSRRAKVGAAWSKPELLQGLAHPEAKRGDMSPSLSADGTRLYFSSDRPGGKGGLDLWSVPVAQLK